MSRLWHDDDYKKTPDDGLYPDDSDGFREYNGLPVDLVYEILSVWRVSRESYYELREKIMELLGSHFARRVSYEQIQAIEQLVGECDKGESGGE